MSNPALNQFGDAFLENIFAWIQRGKSFDFVGSTTSDRIKHKRTHATVAIVLNTPFCNKLVADFKAHQEVVWLNQLERSQGKVRLA